MKQKQYFRNKTEKLEYDSIGTVLENMMLAKLTIVLLIKIVWLIFSDQ